MTYELTFTTDCDLIDWFNIGIDFGPQIITANHVVTNEEKTLVNLKELAINLDNRYIKHYRITKVGYNVMNVKIFV